VHALARDPPALPSLSLRVCPVPSPSIAGKPSSRLASRAGCHTGKLRQGSWGRAGKGDPVLELEMDPSLTCVPMSV